MKEDYAAESKDPMDQREGPSLPAPPTLLAVFAHPDDETFGVGGTLAKYAASGVKVHYVCATKGEAGEAPADLLQGFSDLAELRAMELECACGILGIGQVHYLGYRDSGMNGSEDNLHPFSLQLAPEQEVIGKVVALIRRIRPHVVLTFDPYGAYGHPDHIKMHKVTTRAFHAAADPSEFSGQLGYGLKPHQAQRLYYTTFPQRILRFWLWLLPLAGKDPSRFGVNQDIDLRAVAERAPKPTTRINIRPYLPLKMKAGICYQSQAAPMRDFPLPHWLRNWLMGVESFARAYPPLADPSRMEEDLFEGLEI